MVHGIEYCHWTSFLLPGTVSYGKTQKKHVRMLFPFPGGRGPWWKAKLPAACVAVLSLSHSVCHGDSVTSGNTASPVALQWPFLLFRLRSVVVERYHGQRTDLQIMLIQRREDCEMQKGVMVSNPMLGFLHTASPERRVRRRKRGRGESLCFCSCAYEMHL